MRARGRIYTFHKIVTPQWEVRVCPRESRRARVRIMSTLSLAALLLLGIFGCGRMEIVPVALSSKIAKPQEKVDPPKEETGQSTDNSPPPVDATAPRIAITAPTPWSLLIGGSTVAVQAEANVDVAVVKVDFYVNEKWLCTDTVAPYSCQWTIPPAQYKSYTLRAEAHDAAGLVGHSPDVVVRPR